MTARSGTPTTTNETRKRPMVTITLSEAARMKLDALAEAGGESRSGMVERLVMRARSPVSG